MTKNGLRLTRLFSGAAAAAVFSCLFTLTVFAMNVKISFTDPSAAAGEDVTVSMHVVSTSGEPLGSANFMLNYDPSRLEFVSGDNAQGGAGSLRVSGQTTTNAKEWYYGLHFKALQDGASDITVNTAEVYDANQKIAVIEHQGSSHVTVGGQAAAAAPQLSALTVNPGTLSPAFSPDVASYTAVVGEEVTKIAVNGTAQASDAKVTVSGNENLQMGDNTITVNVASADGSSVGTYTIIVTKQSGSTPASGASEGAAEVTIGDNQYEIADTFDAALLPSGFAQESFTYNGKSVAAGKGKDENLRILYLFAADGSGDLYLYDRSSDKWAPYVEVGTNAKTVTAVPVDSGVTVPAELTTSRLNLNGKSVEGWIGKDDQGSNYCVFYGMNADGEKNFYRFDLKEKTIQRWFNETSVKDATAAPAPEQEELAALQKKYSTRGMELIAAVAVAVIAAAAAVAMAVRGGGKRGYDRDGAAEDERMPERQERKAVQKSEEKEPADGEPDEPFEELPEAEPVSTEETAEAEEKSSGTDPDDDFEDIEL